MKNFRRLMRAWTFRVVLAGAVATVSALAPMPLAAQVVPEAPEAPETPDAATPPDAPDAPGSDGFTYRTPWSRPVVRIGQDYTLRAGERVREMVVVFGSATIAGQVDRDVVVVLGTARLAPTAIINGSLVVAAGGAVIAPGAQVRRDLVVTGGGLDAPPAFSPGGEYVVVGLPGVDGEMEAIIPWFTRGLLWGRLIVPGLSWMWTVVAVIVLVYLVLAVLFERPVRLSRQMVAERPLSSFLMGLLVLILVGPISFVLAVSVVGIPVVPFVLFGLLIAALLGKLGVTRWLGSTIFPEDDPASRGQSIRSFAVGTGVILLAYMVPLLGLFVWMIGGVLGLGAATLAFSSGLRRENRSKSKPPRPLSVEPIPGVSDVAPPVPVVAAQPLTVEPGAVLSEFGSEAEAYAMPVTPSPAAPPSASAWPTPPVRAVVPGELLSMARAPFLDRLAAFALDVLLVSLAYNMLDLRGGRAFFAILLAYHVIFWALKGTTVGGIICNLRVIRTDGGPVSFADALIRGFSSIFSIAALGIGCLWILFDSENQAWHDRFAGTYVVKVPRNWPL
jgi:uncharacterized RDD family membrane protein YckC